jgi:hypothetical protein
MRACKPLQSPQHQRGPLRHLQPDSVQMHRTGPSLWAMPPSPSGPYAAVMAPTRPKTYRVEHHEHGQVQTLGQLTGVAPHHATLEIFVGDLLRRGAGGMLLLIDETTGAVVARRQVRPFASKPRDRFRAT